MNGQVICFCDGYTGITANSAYGAQMNTDNVCWIEDGRSIRFHDDIYNGDTAAFKASLSGKVLFYPRPEDPSFIPPQTRTITTFLPSANSFIDAQKASNNVECDWKFKVLDGTETGWGYSSTAVTGHNTFTLTIADTSKDNAFIPLSTVYEGTPASISFSGLGNGQFKHASSSTTYYFVDDRFDNVTAFKAWLAENPVIIGYLLATPEVTTVTLSELTQPLGTVTILNEFADGTKGAVDFYGVNIQVNTPVPKPDEPYPLLSNVGEVSYGQYGRNQFSSGLDRCTWSQVLEQRVYKVSSTTRVGSADFIPVKPNTNYTLKMMGTQTFTSGNWRFMLCDSDNICRQKISSSNIEHTLKFTTGATEVKFAFFIAEDKTSLEGWDWMLVEGDEAPTVYEPYHFGWHGDGQQTVKMESANLLSPSNIHQGTIVAYSPYAPAQTRTTSEILPSATSKLNMQGGPDNKDCDWAFIQFDGSETGWATATSGYYTLEMSDLKLSLSDRTLYCTHLKSSASMPSTGEREGTCVISYGSSKGYISMGMVEQFPDIADFKAWLAEVKPIVAYPRATSVKSTVATTPLDVPAKTTYVLTTKANDDQSLDVSAEFLGM